MSTYVAECALEALLLEVAATPKPGLVDRRNNGAHRDMNFYTFIRSALSLRPHFAIMAQAGQDLAQKPPQELFNYVRILGLAAEKDMFAATNNINTHKGALFALGLLCASAGQACCRSADRSGWQPAALGQFVAQMSQGLCQRELADLNTLAAQATNATQATGAVSLNNAEPDIKVRPTAALTHGQRMYLQYGACGARGQAESGFAQVIEKYLPYLRDLKKQQLDQDEILVRTLLLIGADLDDTNILNRVGATKAAWAKEACAALHEHYTHEAACQLDDLFIKERISPGGSADLLSVTIFLDKLAASEKYF
ncbi:MAG: triphosphoribosyl-dephospho-CoA synthase [Candidatus Bruticola sp.]